MLALMGLPATLTPTLRAPRREPASTRREPVFVYGAAATERAEPTLAFVQIDPYAIKVWPAGTC